MATSKCSSSPFRYKWTISSRLKWSHFFGISESISLSKNFFQNYFPFWASPYIAALSMISVRDVSVRYIIASETESVKCCVQKTFNAVDSDRKARFNDIIGFKPKSKKRPSLTRQFGTKRVTSSNYITIFVRKNQKYIWKVHSILEAIGVYVGFDCKFGTFDK